MAKLATTIVHAFRRCMLSPSLDKSVVEILILAARHESKLSGQRGDTYF